MTEAAAQAAQVRERRNWLIHLLYTRHDYVDCLNLIEEQLRESRGLCEYPLYIKGLIKRGNGDLQESLALFQAATMMNPHNVANLKQVGRSLFLLGKHKAAIDVYEEALNFSDGDWELTHNIGMCYQYLKDFQKAEECYTRANAIQRHDKTYMELGRLFTEQGKYEQAVEIYLEALEFSPENPEMLTTIGLLYLRLKQVFKAVDLLGNSMTLDPRNPKTILAAGSIIQDHQDFDVALSKYRVAAVQTPNSAQLWNNIGTCFFGKKNHIAAISSLRRALYLAPFEWIIAYNLGLVFLHTGQYASAFHYLSASINLQPDFAATYVYLAVCLSRLDDYDNACSSYEKAVSMEMDHEYELNYAVTLFNCGELEAAKFHLQEFERLFDGLDEEEQSNKDVLKVRKQLTEAIDKAMR